MGQNPFEHFEEQQRSFEFLEEHRVALAAEAAEQARVTPEMKLVGLILGRGASEAKPLREALEKATGRGFLGVVPREFVLHILRANVPAALEWLEASTTSGPTRKLPLVVSTTNGFRLGAVDYEVGLCGTLLYRPQPVGSG